MPNRAVVSVLVAVLPSPLPHCCPLPSAALQVLLGKLLWIKSTSLCCFCRDNIYLRSFSGWFPCCFLCQLKIAEVFLVYSSHCAGWDLTLELGLSARLTCRTASLMCSSQGGLPVSSCGPLASSVPLLLSPFFCLPFGWLLGWEVLWWYSCQGLIPCSHIYSSAGGAGEEPS